MKPTPDELEGLREVGRKALRPGRARLAEARAAVAGISDAREAWETLGSRGFVPEREIHAEHRAFRREGGEWQRTPPTVDDAAVVASDFAAMRTAEELAREFAAAMRALGAACGERFAWSTDWARGVGADGVASGDGWPAGEELKTVFAALIETMQREYAAGEYGRVYEPASEVLKASGFPKEEGRPGDEGNPYPWWYVRCAYEQAQLDRLWRHAAAKGNKLRPSSRSPLRHLRGAAFAEQKNPFTPLLSVWKTGYAVDALTPEGVVLVCPRVVA